MRTSVTIGSRLYGVGYDIDVLLPENVRIISGLEAEVATPRRGIVQVKSTKILNEIYEVMEEV